MNRLGDIVSRLEDPDETHEQDDMSARPIALHTRTSRDSQEATKTPGTKFRDASSLQTPKPATEKVLLRLVSKSDGPPAYALSAHRHHNAVILVRFWAYGNTY